MTSSLAGPLARHLPEEQASGVETESGNIDPPPAAESSSRVTVVAPAVRERTTHTLVCGDARELDWIPDQSVHLVVTSPPYWTLKTYHDHPHQLGHVADYECFLGELDKVWFHCHRVLVPGGRLVCVVGDVCLSRRRHGRHRVVPLHADIAVRAQRLGYDYLTPILWNKITNAAYEVKKASGGFLGKPYEPNGIIKNDVEYILMMRKPGGYRQPTAIQREQSRLTKSEHGQWFRSFWSDIPGAHSKSHPAPFPIALAYRLARMFSFVGDTILDPFGGLFTTAMAAIQAGRNSVGVELDPEYYQEGLARVSDEIARRCPTDPGREGETASGTGPQNCVAIARVESDVSTREAQAA